MKNNIIQLEKIDEQKKFLGNKTLNLKKCADWGFNVPKFIALPSYISKNLLTEEVSRKKIAGEAINILQTSKYAVRSSALIEDGENQSFAGQFLTKINISGAELNQGIYEVLRQAKVFLKGDLDKFSIIIQEYITPDISGVAFTRNPNGNREMIIEYGFCEGEKIVGGAIKPNKISFFWNNQSAINLPKLFYINQIVERFKELENKNSFPQDIEWCIKGSRFYLLQTRPITTISREQYEQVLFLDDFLPKDEKYYFEKTDISEIAPRPSTITYDLLNFIYSKKGPVYKVYKKYGVNYENTDFLKIIGNELFVDKEKEIQGLLPAYSYLHNKDFIPRFYIFLKLLPTIKNFFSINKIKTGNYEKIFNNLKTKIESNEQRNSDLKTTLKKFLYDYELIFETNLLSGLSIKKVGLLLRGEPVNFTEVLSGYSDFIDLTRYQVQYPPGLKGNFLELTDESGFIAHDNTESKSSSKIVSWWRNIPEYRKKMMRSLIAEAIIYNRLREFGRWLTIKNINSLKILLLSRAGKNGFGDVKNIYFANLDDVLNNKIEESLCIKNKSLYDRCNRFSLPNSITSTLIFRKSKALGVSSGLASGILQSQETIEAGKDENRKYILYTEILSPDLTKYFDKIFGIVSNNGGLLSHLAIMAREKNIPVVVGFSIADSEFKLGDYVQIDGSSGNIVKIKAVR